MLFINYPRHWLGQMRLRTLNLKIALLKSHLSLLEDCLKDTENDLSVSGIPDKKRKYLEDSSSDFIVEINNKKAEIQTLEMLRKNIIQFLVSTPI